MPISASDFFDAVAPGAFPEHILRYRNQRLGRTGRPRHADRREWMRHFGRFEPLPGSLEPAAGAALPRPSVPQLTTRARRRPRLPVRPAARSGDGRLLDLGTKGSGRRRRGRAAATAG